MHRAVRSSVIGWVVALLIGVFAPQDTSAQTYISGPVETLPGTSVVIASRSFPVFAIEFSGGGVATGDITNGLDVDVTRLPVAFNTGAASATTVRTITSTDDLGVVALQAIDASLPAAAALADNTANPTLSAIAAYLMCFDSSTWDRCQLASDWTISSAIGTTAPGSLVEAKDFDGAALPLTSGAAEGDGIPVAGSLYGVQYTMLVNEDGSLSPLVVEDVGETAANVLMGVGSVRRDVAASSAGATGDNATFNTDALGLAWSRFLDPCSGVAKTHIPINISTATTTELTPSLAGASTNYYICSIDLVTAAANNVALTDDDSDGCGSVTSGLAGGTSAASGWNFAANGGLTKGNGLGTIYKTGGANRVVCMVTSASTQLSGSIEVVAAP